MKNEIKHTPSPWKVQGQDIIGNELNGYICTWSGRSANAQLIAVAPELLEALKVAVQHIDPLSNFYEWELSKKAIAKATGAE